MSNSQLPFTIKTQIRKQTGTEGLTYYADWKYDNTFMDISADMHQKIKPDLGQYSFF